MRLACVPDSMKRPCSSTTIGPALRFFFQAEDGIRDIGVTGVQTCALPISLNNRALSTSGNYRKYFIKDGVKYSHDIDPITGYPVHHTLLAVSVLSDNSMTADAFCCAFLVMGKEKALEFLKNNPGLDAYFIYSDEKGTLKTQCSRSEE